MKLLREAPTTTGMPERGDLPQPPQQLEVVLEGLAEADSGVEPDPLLGDPGGDRRLGPLGEEGADLVDDVVVDGVALHRPRVAEHVHEDQAGAALGDQRADLGVGAQRGDVVDDRRPGPERRLGDRRFEVSIEIETPSAASASESPRTTGSVRRSSSAAPTSSAPGRVDSPPTSRISAPCAASSRPWSIAAAGIEVEASVGKGVGGDVDHPHQPDGVRSPDRSAPHRRQRLGGGALAGCDRPVHVAAPHGRRLRTGPVDRADRGAKRRSVRPPGAGRQEAAVAAGRVGVRRPGLVDVALRLRRPRRRRTAPGSRGRSPGARPAAGPPRPRRRPFEEGEQDAGRCRPAGSCRRSPRPARRRWSPAPRGPRRARTAPGRSPCT